MTDDATSDLPATPADPSAEVEESAGLPVDEVKELFVLMGKALRAVQLYDENNPVYQRFVSSLKQAFTNLWTSIDDLPVTVEEDRFRLIGEEVYRAQSRTESISFLFFKDGVREITFLPGIEGEELERFLGVLQTARHARSDGDDLLTILWEADLDHLQYHFIDLLSEGIEIPEPTGEIPQNLGQVLQEEVGEGEEEEDTDEPEEAAQEGEAAPPPSSISREDFNPTLYALDPSEMDSLRRELETEMNRNLRVGVLAALFDRVEEPAHRERQSEILSVIRTLLPNFLSRDAMSSAAGVVRELARIRDLEGVFDEERSQQVDRLLAEISSPAAVSELVKALEDGTMQPSAEDLSSFLGHLDVSALAPLLRAAELSGEKGAGPALQEAATGMGGNNREALLELLESPDPIVAVGAARLAGSLKMQEAGPALSTLMSHREPMVRKVAVDAGRTLNVSTVTSGLQTALTDSEVEVRIAAARALGDMRYAPAAPRMKSILESKAIRNADLSEKIAFFEAYGLMGGDRVVPMMDQLLNGRGFLGRKENPEIRACAALALGKVGSEQALIILQRAADETDPVIRNAINRALKGGE
jgi:HEAT repeat protein